jgi:ribose 5-phosphate isomerase B
MSIYITSDHAGFELKKKILKLLPDLNLIDLSPILQVGDDYPLVAKALVEKMSKNDIAIAICGTGVGICMALNRNKNIRAVVLNDTETTILAKKHNQANVICLSGRLIKPKKAVKLIKIFLKTESDLDKRHVRRISQIS